MLLFKDRPIKQKFLLVIMVVNLTTLLLAFSTFMFYDRWQVQKTMVRQTAAIADILAFNCTAALMFDDSADARETLAFLKTKPSILAAWIFTAKGVPLTHYVREGFGKEETPPPVQKDGYILKNQMLYFYKEARLEGKPIGTVFVRSDMRRMTELVEDHFLIAIVALLFSLLVSFLLSVRFQKTIANPIVELAALSRTVSKEKDYAVRASKRGNDELGSLVDAFNEMLQQIERQNASLVEAGKSAEESAWEALRLAERVTQTNLKLENEIRIRKDVEKTLQKHRESLEMRILERTKELRESNQQLREEVEERIKAEKKIQNSLDEKVLLLGEIHHRVKNNLQVISSLMDLTRRRTLNEEARMVLADARSKIYAMSLVHSQLYRSESFTRIDMAVHARRLLGSMGQIYTNSYRRVRPRLECSKVFLSVTQAIPCALVLNELISNVYKHAYPEDATGECLISMAEMDGKWVHFRVKDDGIGIPEEIEIEGSETLGLKLIRNLVRKQLKGEVRFKRDNGTDITAEFPIDHDDVLIHGGQDLTSEGRFPSKGLGKEQTQEKKH
ncbi:MAG TPA: histidine kinase dimerization/phosphoacceptor domain -containing protein [Desulfobacteria bacterium]|nr:histidine kinase dimerization/phosphoacceptor domain -containing protein [Desulfobacteria bacterium]